MTIQPRSRLAADCFVRQTRKAHVRPGGQKLEQMVRTNSVPAVRRMRDAMGEEQYVQSLGRIILTGDVPRQSILCRMTVNWPVTKAVFVSALSSHLERHPCEVTVVQ